jgi:hypothetical protein
MTWAPEDTAATNKPGMPAMAQAYARWADKDGGLHGHHLTVITCNEHNTSAGAAACADRAVKEQVLAVVGSYSQFSNTFLSTLESAGIPYIGGYGLTDDEFTSPMSYPVNGGLPALVAGNGRQLAGNCADVALVRPATIAGDALPPLFDEGLRTTGHDPAVDVHTSEDATDYTATAQLALDHVASSSGTGCVSVALGDRTATFTDSYRRVADDYPEVRLGSVLGSVGQADVDSTGGTESPYEGAYLTGWYPVSSDSRWDAMKKVISTYAFGDNRIDPTDAGVQTTWIAYTVLRRAVEAMGDKELTPVALRSALNNGLRISTGGLTPTLSWRFKDLLASQDYPRLVNTDVTFQVVRDGRLVSAHKGFVNVAGTLTKATS